MRWRGVVFDMDGTITKPYLDFVALRRRLGADDHTDLIEFLNGLTGAEQDRANAILDEFESDGIRNAELNPDTRDVLAFLSERQLPVALLTRNSRRSVEAICAKFNLRFDLVFTRENAPAKPSPEPVWFIARQWGVPVESLLLVGDYKWDMVCARQAGATGVALLNNDDLPDWAAQADCVIRKLSDLKHIILSEGVISS